MADVEKSDLTDAQLVSCFRQTNILLRRNDSRIADLERQNGELEERLSGYTAELIRRGYRVQNRIR